MSNKYYDDVNQYPNSTYPKNNGEITKIKTIRLTQEEEVNWDSKAIHDFLQGLDKSNDSIKINTLKHYLKGLYDIMVNKMDPNSSLDTIEKELLKNISEVVDYE